VSSVATPRLLQVAVSTSITLRVAVQGDPGGRPLLLLPGYVDSWYSYSRVLAALPAHLRAYVIDLRGHGGSSKPGCCYRVDDLAGDVIDCLGVMGVERVTLVGHSGSCFVARHVALTRPDIVEGLVFLAAPLVLDGERLRPFRDQLLTFADSVEAGFVREFQLGAAERSLAE
jgi:pimeloyl-ACP methyl ester carboxylesterase